MTAHEAIMRSPEVKELATELNDLGFPMIEAISDRWGFIIRCHGHGQVIEVTSSTLLQGYRAAIAQAKKHNLLPPLEGK